MKQHPPPTKDLAPEVREAVAAERERLLEALKISGGCLWCRLEHGHSTACLIAKAFETV